MTIFANLFYPFTPSLALPLEGEGMGGGIFMKG
jgi:hypothetical protein